MRSMRRGSLLILLLVAIGCKTVGVSREAGGYARVRPSVAQLMLIDNRQLVVFDFRDNHEYWGPDGHIAGALSVPLSVIETRLPELVPYQNNTVLVYGETNEEGVSGATILTAAGFRNVVLIDGGIRGWLDGGYRTVTSP